MNNAVAPVKDKTTLMHEVIIKGDLRNLTPEQQGQYYMKVCESTGLNPLTKPFEYIVLNGKMVLYALRGCTDQLRAIHNISVVELSESDREGVFIVTAKVTNGEGRTDAAKGAVNIQGLKGDALANALMKAETKAKRRATLSICGLGLLDESELETIPQAAISPVANASMQKQVYGTAKAQNDRFIAIQEELQACETNEDLAATWKRNQTHLKALAAIDPQFMHQLEGIKDQMKTFIEDANAVRAGFGDDFAKINDAQEAGQ